MGDGASGERTGSRSTEREGGWGAAGAPWPGVFCAVAERAAPARSKATSALLQWSIVARASMDSKWWQPLWWIQLYLYFTPLAVAADLLGRVADHILVAQFGGNLFRDVAHFGEIVHSEHASAGLLAEFVEQQGAGPLLGRGGIWIEDADGVNFNVRFADYRANLALGVT